MQQISWAITCYLIVILNLIIRTSLYSFQNWLIVVWLYCHMIYILWVTHTIHLTHMSYTHDPFHLWVTHMKITLLYFIIRFASFFQIISLFTQVIFMQFIVTIIYLFILQTIDLFLHESYFCSPFFQNRWLAWCAVEMLQFLVPARFCDFLPSVSFPVK